MRAAAHLNNCSSSSSSRPLLKASQPAVWHRRGWQRRSLRPCTRLSAAFGPQQQPPEAQQTDPAAAAAAAAAAETEQEVLHANEQLAVAAAADQDGGVQVASTSSSSTAAATALYLALAGGLAAAGLLVSLYAAPIAASCLSLGSLSLQQAAALVGCSGAALLRAASLAGFLAGGAAAAELCTWRYQRINLGLAAAAAVTALLQPLSWGCASPLMLLVLVACAAAVAAACTGAFLQQWRQEGVRFASAIGYSDLGGSLRAVWVYLLRDATTLAGSLMLLLGMLAACAGLTALSTSAAVSAVPWAGALGSAAEPGLQYLRKLLGVGLLLTGLQCWALAEFAGSARKVSPETAVKLVLVMADEVREVAAGKLRAPLHVSPRRFDLLHVGFFAAAAVQWAWLAQAGAAAGSGGVLDVNGADPVWRLLYWGVLGAAGYLVSVVGSLDYVDVWCWVVGVGSYLSGWVSFFASVLYVDWTWLTEVRRR